MFQNALTSISYSPSDVATLYIKRLNLLGDKVLAEKKFGIEQNINKLEFVKIKNLLNYIDRLDTVLITKFSTTEITYISNKLIDCIN